MYAVVALSTLSTDTKKTMLSCPLDNGHYTTEDIAVAEARALYNKRCNPSCDYFVVQFISKVVKISEPQFRMEALNA